MDRYLFERLRARAAEIADRIPIAACVGGKRYLASRAVPRDRWQVWAATPAHLIIAGDRGAVSVTPYGDLLSLWVTRRSLLRFHVAGYGGFFGLPGRECGGIRVEIGDAALFVETIVNPALRRRLLS